MPGISDWLDRLKAYGSNAMSSYGSTAGQAQALPGELAARAQMQDQARIALGQQPVTNMQQAAPAPVAPAATLAPYEYVNPGYTPIGGESALRKTLAGRPPALTKSAR